MRILFHHRTRGTDAQRIHIREIIAAFCQAGHDVREASLVSVDSPDRTPQDEAREAGWKALLRRLPGGYDAVQLGYNLVGIPMLLRWIRRFRPDFVYERYALYNFAGVVAARFGRIPLVLEVNSPLALEHSSESETISYRFASWTERVICRKASLVIAVSTPLRRILEENGVPSERITVMPNGVDTDRFRPRKGCSIRSKLGLNGTTVVGFVGWFRPWHGIEDLLEAVAAVRLSLRNVKVLLVGDGPALPRLQDLVKERGLADSVIFTGPIPHEDIPDCLDAIDIAAQPAVNEYACPMKILEYMGMGKAILAPRQENIEEILRDGSEAVLFEPGNQDSLIAGLQRLIEPAGCPEECSPLGSSGKDAAADRHDARSGAEFRRRLGEAARRAIFERRYLWSENARRVTDLMREPNRDESGPRSSAEAE